MIGKIFNNRYQIIEKLGAGGTAIVYRGQDMLLNRMVTIKILRDEYAGNNELVRRFQHEAQAVASLSHPNIVAVYDVGFEENMHYIVMEFVEGESLKEYIKRSGTLKMAEACNIITQILSGVEHAHEHGIIHRDLKPHNILLGKDGRAKVTDFGIAVGMSDATLTYSNSSRIMGSVHYISPEQVQGLPVTEKSDIYSLGVVFYEMLAGRLPFVGETPISIAMQHVQGELILPHQVNPNIPMGLSYVVMRAMRKNPETRYASAAEMAEAVRSAYQAAMEGKSTPQKAESISKLSVTESLGKHIMPEEIIDDKVEETAPIRRLNISRLALLVAAAVLVIVIVLIAGHLAGLLDVGNKTMELPNLINMTQEEAETTLVDMGLLVSLTSKSSTQYEAGRVMEQSPEAYTEVTEGRTINLVISEGEETVTVPDLSTNSQRIAEITLANLGLVSSVTEEYNLEVPKGELIVQSPQAGSKVAPGSMVELLFSLGKQPEKFVMEKLIGKTIEEATAYIDSKQLSLTTVTQVESYEQAADKIVSQSIAAGSETETGTELALEISKGPGPIGASHNVYYVLPLDYNEDGQPVEIMHTVKITVNDNQSFREVFNQQLAGGTTVAFDVTYYGVGTITLYVDDATIEVYSVY